MHKLNAELTVNSLSFCEKIKRVIYFIKFSAQKLICMAWSKGKEFYKIKSYWQLIGNIEIYGEKTSVASYIIFCHFLIKTIEENISCFFRVLTVNYVTTFEKSELNP